MYRHRELLTSLLASAMLTTSFLPAQGADSLAGVVDPAAAGRFMSAVFSHMPDGGWAMPDVEIMTAPAPSSVIAVNLSASDATQPPITPEKFKALFNRALLSQKNAVIGADVAVPLGLSAGGDITTKQIRSDNGADRHYFSVPIPLNGKIFIGLRKGGTLHLSACDMDGKLLAAGTLIDEVFAAVPLDVARAGFEAELRFFNRVEITPPSTGSA